MLRVGICEMVLLVKCDGERGCKFAAKTQLARRVRVNLARETRARELARFVVVSRCARSVDLAARRSFAGRPAPNERRRDSAIRLVRLARRGGRGGTGGRGRRTCCRGPASARHCRKGVDGDAARSPARQRAGLSSHWSAILCVRPSL